MPLRLSRTLIHGIFTVSLPLTTLAQDLPLTLREAVAHAQERAPTLRGADAAARAADAGVEVAGLRPNPTLSIEAENVLGTGRYSGFGGADRTVSLAVPLELGGKRQARINVAQAERAAAGIGLTGARADLTQRVTEAFVRLAAAQRRQDIAHSALEWAERAAHAAQERVRTGKASPIEEQRAQVLKLGADTRFGKAVRALALAHADLTQLTGDAALAISASWFDTVALVESAPSGQPSLSVVAAQAQLAIANARVDAARRDRMPDVTITAGTRRYGDSPDKAAVLSLSIPLPLFNSGSGALVRAKAQADQANAEGESAAIEAQQALAHAVADVADARAVAQTAAGPALTAAQEAARIARLGYAEGKFPQLEMIEAERSLAETREAALEALTDYHLAQVRLARLQGSIQPIYKD
ncbi:TolC family protein [Duganella sp. FT80W]|uniref:TolC family protein n=1 Tax=Duganella guangzhouensis TaxID=2666084 RepID=A0A6I2L6B2_9BURK|nr:TolC family protein [Duganella guangzhouensis]